MRWLKWLPWRFLVRRIAYAHGFLDPIALLARLHRESSSDFAAAIGWVAGLSSKRYRGLQQGTRDKAEAFSMPNLVQ